MILLFADGIAIIPRLLSSNIDQSTLANDVDIYGLTSLINYIKYYSYENKIIFNHKKSKILLFSNNKDTAYTCSATSLKMDSRLRAIDRTLYSFGPHAGSIDFTDSYKYLGINLDRKLSMTSHNVNLFNEVKKRSDKY